MNELLLLKYIAAPSKFENISLNVQAIKLIL
jgi:hypothetical protein